VARRKNGEDWVEQTVIVKKSHPAARARGRAGAAEVAEKHTGEKPYTSRQTKGSFRFRQRPLDCFAKGKDGKRIFKTQCRGKGKQVCVVWGPLAKGAKKRRACR
jgi:hypothetical protein